MSDIWIVFSIIAAIIVLFALDIVPVIAVCMGAALALWASGILTLQQSLELIAQPPVRDQAQPHRPKPPEPKRSG